MKPFARHALVVGRPPRPRTRRRAGTPISIGSRGFALITAVMVGAILVIIVATGATYLLGSSQLTTAGRTGDRADNAARGGLAKAIAEFDTGSPQAVATSDVTFDQAKYTITVTEVGDGYIVESVGTFGNTTRKLRSLIQPAEEDWGQYAIAAKGDVDLQNHSFVASLPETGKGDVRSNDTISLMKHSSIWGSAMAVSDVTTDAKSHVWNGAQYPFKSLKFPAYTDNQIQGFVDDAKASKEAAIDATTLPEGKLDGYYYSHEDYDVFSAQNNGATLTLTKGTYTLSGTMFVAGKLLIESHVTITGEGRIIATEGITVQKHVEIMGTAQTSHADLVSLYGDIEVRNHVTLGQVSSGLKGRKSDTDDGKNSKDDDYLFGDDDLLWADKRDPDLTGSISDALAASGKDSSADADNGIGNDEKVKQDEIKTKLKKLISVDPGTSTVALPWRKWLAMAVPAIEQALVPPALAKDDDGVNGKGNDDDEAASAGASKGKSGDIVHGKHWKKKYKGTIPVGCTIFAMKGDVTIAKHVTVVGNIIAGGNVDVTNHSDVIRNSADPVQSVGIFAWKSTSIQTVN